MRCWFGIRHLRWCWYAWQLARWVDSFRTYGYSHASPADLAYLDAVWEGKR